MHVTDRLAVDCGDATMRRIATVFIAATLGLSACDDRAKTSADSSPTPATAPTTQPSATLNIDGQLISFPPARITTNEQGGGLDVVLSTEDSGAGNGFMFEMKLDVEKAGELPTIAWEFKAPDELPQDSMTGIFLSDRHRRLQPTDVKVTFEKKGEGMMARVAGRFIEFDPEDATVVVRVVDVQGQVGALVQEQN
jgi:hypothetical protein